MFAINHAATALPLKKAFPSAPFVPLLVSVQLLEVLWVGLNYAGVEATTTAPVVASVVDVHLAYMPFSHSVLSAILIAAVVALALWRTSGTRAVGWAVAAGVVSHLVLDLITHSPDIAIAPFMNGRELGLGAWRVPIVGLSVELGWGVLCWALFQGSAWLLGAIVLFNAGNIPFLFPQIAGPEGMLAGRPMLAVSFVLGQIVVTWVVVWLLARGRVAALEHHSVG